MSRKRQEKSGTGQKLRFPWDIVSEITARGKFLRTSAKFRSPIALDFAGRANHPAIGRISVAADGIPTRRRVKSLISHRNTGIARKTVVTRLSVPRMSRMIVNLDA